MDYVPQCIPDRRPLLMWLVVALGALSFFSLIVVAPIGFASGSVVIAPTIYQAFNHICHQIPERSFFLHGYPLAVCARCTGVYAGFAVAALAYPATMSLRRVHAPERKWLFLAALPLGLDFGLDLIGVWQNTHLTRFLTGAGMGAAALFFVLPGLVELSLRRRGSHHGNSDTENGSGALTAAEQLVPAASDYSFPDRRI